MKNLLALGVLCLLPGLSFAQQKPKAKPAAKTESAAPPAGPYFQQDVKYSIDVALDDQKHELTGKEELVYTNNSPQALPFIWFHLWPNAYRDNSTAFAKEQLRHGERQFYFASAAQRGYIDGLDFKVNGQAAKLEFDPENPDIAKLVLPQPLAAGATITISTPFHVKLPNSFSRMGHVGQSYQVTQWYPKPAVLDRRGWHPMPYLSQGEFYSEFGSFDVTITLPSNYTVGATGELQNPDEQARLAGLAAESANKKTAADYGEDLSFPASAPTTKTLRYIQDRVHDFAWFADKRFNVLKDAVTLPSGRKVDTWVLFTNRNPEDWVKGLQDLNAAISNYSKWVGEYPYAAATAVDGALVAGGGMEYPMVTVTLPEAIVHEAGHNWFYGILASNERDFPWLDEGVNTYHHLRVQELTNPGAGILAESGATPKIVKALGLENLPSSAFNLAPYQIAASHGADQPVQGPGSAAYSGANYGSIVYFKTAALLKYLAGYLGQDVFDRAMQAYYQEWKFKHPYPEDMQVAFERSTGQKLGWFFKEMLTNTQEYNADIGAIAVFNDVVKVLVATDSPTPWAVPVSSVDAQGKVLETLWTTPFGNTEPDPEEDATSQLNFKRENVAAIVVDANYVAPQLNRRDDRLKLSGSLPRWEPLRLRPLVSLERWDKSTLNWLPVAGYNTSDKFMLGAAFYNSPLTPKKIQYLAMPMYAFGSNELNGIGSIQLNVLPGRFARRVITAATVQRFERYLKFEPSLTLKLPHRGFYRQQHEVGVSVTSVKNEDFNRTSSVQTLEYRLRGGNSVHSWGGHLELNRLVGDDTETGTGSQATLLRAALNYQRYYSPKNKIYVRLFAGSFLQKNNQQEFYMGLSNSLDYRRQTAFLDRQESSPALAAFRHQTDDRDGAFKAFLPVLSNNWLTTLNVKADVPKLPLAVFADFGLGSVRDLSAPNFPIQTETRSYYDAGLTVPLFRELLEFYIPVVGSQFGNGLPNSRQQFTDNIRFVLRLNNLSPFRLLDEQIAK
ncbi:hypothetical protein GCM10023185_05790 [Hymenobacter saemangeumensis]|uniref:Peptidase M1 membrane alanine aminopeptidase domain-containing protein n=1 Tax=Hymenobacter saemangeumensis TaxID=1084522 RepID=A0ABP8I1N8_9BACT